MNKREEYKMNFDKGVEFDPGYVQHITAFVPNIEYIYSTLEKFKNFGQRKLQFKMFYPNIQSLLANYTGFYLGCMLWAAYIKTLDNKPVLNNLCYGGDYSEVDTLEEIDFVINYVEQLKKDVKYYLGQNFSIDSATQNVLEAYREFLKLNKGFVGVLNTGDIKLPETLKTPKASDCELILAKIEEVVENGNLSDLYSMYEKLF